MSRKSVKIYGSVGLNVFIIIPISHSSTELNSHGPSKNERMSFAVFIESFKIDHLGIMTSLFLSA